MRIIGVIDLKDGRAVHARGGHRDAYRRVERAAGVAIDGSGPDLARAYIDVFGVEELYVADLNAIGGGTADHDAVSAISRLGVPVMVDAGIATAEDAQRTIAAGASTVVVGLETLPSFDALSEICRSIPGVVFSLDLRDGNPLGAGTAGTPERIAERAFEAGAASLIVLDVGRVGGSAGPDLAMLARIRRALPRRPVLAGGAVRGVDDLRQLADIGCAGALVASALIEGRLSRADVAAARLTTFRDTPPSGRSSPPLPSRSP